MGMWMRDIGTEEFEIGCCWFILVGLKMPTMMALEQREALKKRK